MRQPIQPPGTKASSAPLSSAIDTGEFIYVSGQGALDPATGTYLKADVQSETRQVFENIKTILQAAGSSLDRVVKCNVYLRDINDFAAMNEVYKTYFSTPYPARTTIQAGALPLGFAVEIECIAGKGR
ncbi:MAG TPA: Rid family detoxifying hydrolase [Planctomycetota bacterium]|nr:Rid family detoxifying hydrolase [Planctomycetota bacterium]